MLSQDDRLKKIGELVLRGRLEYGSNIGTQDGRKKLSQADLYRKCYEFESNRKKGNHENSYFLKLDTRTGERKIRAIEQGKIAATDEHLRIIGAVLHISFDEFFERQCNHCAEALQEVCQHERMIDVSSLMEIEGDNGKLYPRYEDANALTNFFKATKKNVSVYVVSSPSGYGKSHLISAWWKSEGCFLFENNVLSLDCSKIAGDTIIRSIGKYFGHEVETIDSILADILNKSLFTLIILDGLSLESATQEKEQICADKETLLRVIEFINSSCSCGGHLAFILCIQTVQEKKTNLKFSFPKVQNFSEVQLKLLDQNEGMLLFKYLDVNHLSDDDLQRMSIQLMGMPMAICVAAKFMKEAHEKSDFFNDESCIALNIVDSEDFKVFVDFYNKIIGLLEQLRQNKFSSPHALLRLLALFSGSIHKEAVELLLEKRKIVRLGEASLDRMLGENIPFIMLSGDLITLHPYAKRCILNEFQDVVMGKIIDENITRYELQWIHIVMSTFFLSKIKPKEKIYKADIALIEGALHHLLSLSELLPLHPSLIDDIEFRRFSEFVKDTNSMFICKYCYESLIKKYFLDARKQATRFLGYYETKARMLGYFCRMLLRSPSSAQFDDVELCRVFTEIGICWMHAGRLKLAQDAIFNALKYIRNDFNDPYLIFNNIISNNRMGFDREEWIRYAQLSSISALIMMRLGRGKSSIDDVLEKSLAISNLLFDSIDSMSVDSVKSLTGVLLAAKNIITRNAFIRYLSGDIDMALSDYCDASYVEFKLKRPCLSGDAAFRYVVALLRSEKNKYGKFIKAKEIIKINNKMKDEEKELFHRHSNDIIATYTLLAMMSRVEGNLKEARYYLDKAFNHEYYSSGEAPYSAIQELKLESYKLMYVSGFDKNSLCESLYVMFHELENRHHGFLALQVKLLIAELQTENPSKLLDEVEARSLILGWYIFTNDISNIRENFAKKLQI